MKSVEQFFLEQYGPGSPSAAFSASHSTLPKEVREAANRGWMIFPVPELAKLAGNPELLIDEATNERSRLEELAGQYYPLRGWRIVVGPALCIVERIGQQGRDSYEAVAPDQEECLTLQADLGNAALAFYLRPKGLVLRASARTLGPGLRIFVDGDSCEIGPFANPRAEIEGVPYWLQDLAFETPDTPRGIAAPVPALPHRPAPCRSRAQFQDPQSGVRKSYPVSGHAGGRCGFRISRRS